MVYRKNERKTYLEQKYYVLISLCCLLFISIYLFIFLTTWSIDFGGDFSHFYAASLMAANGNIIDVYKPQLFQSMMLKIEKITGFNEVYCWQYPPTYLILLLPLSQLPYLSSFMVWILITLICYLLTIYHIAPKSITFLITMAFPATFHNFFVGQNGFLSASLFGMGLCLLESRPFLGGILLGFISYKPQFFILIPIALIAGKQWRALIGAASSAIGLVLISVLAFGLGSWMEFYRTIPSTFGTLRNAENLPKMISVFSSTVLMAGGPTLGWMLQGLIMIAAVAAVIWVWRDGHPYLRNSLLAVSILLFTPHLFYYDLCLLGIPLAWLGWQGYKKGWVPGQQIILSLGWLLPSLMLYYRYRIGMVNIILPIAPLILIAIYIFILIRHWTEKQRDDRY